MHDARFSSDKNSNCLRVNPYNNSIKCNLGLTMALIYLCSILVTHANQVGSLRTRAIILTTDIMIIEGMVFYFHPDNC